MKKKAKTAKRKNPKRSKNMKIVVTQGTSNPGSMVKVKEVKWSVGPDKTDAEGRAEQVRREVAEYWRTAEGRAMQLRIDVVAIVLSGMKARGWKPKDLAKRTRYGLAEIRQIMSADYDLDTEGLGELLYVLDTRVNFNIRT